MVPPPSTNPEAPVIRMEDVAFGSMRDPDRIVAERVNWTVARGDFWVVGGLHGTGKSDLLMMTAGLMPPLRGHYWFLREPMPIFDDARLPTRLRLGLVFENGQLLNHLTVRENIALPLRYHRDLSTAQANTEVETLMETLEITSWADTTPGAISRSVQKRAGLGRALALKPEVLLLDNPLSGLDLRQIQWWAGFLGGLSEGHSLFEGRPLTLVASAADLRPWRRHARQCAILHQHSLSVVDSWTQLQPGRNSMLDELVAAPERTSSPSSAPTD